MKLTFEKSKDKYGRPIIKTTCDSIEYTQDDYDNLMLDILKHIGETLFPELSDERMKFENAVWYHEKKKALGKPNP